MTAVAIVLVGLVAWALGLSIGRGSARKDALDAMETAFEDVRYGPTRVACIALRLRWQLALEHERDGGVMRESLSELVKAELELEIEVEHARRSGEP